MGKNKVYSMTSQRRYKNQHFKNAAFAVKFV